MACCQLQPEGEDQLVQVEGFLLSWVDTSAGPEVAPPGGFDSSWSRKEPEAAEDPLGAGHQQTRDEVE